MNIRNSTALVTGANRGLGRAFVDALLAAGARRVYAAARNPSPPVLPEVVPLRLDITDPASISSAARAAADVDLLINNAGVFGPSLLLKDDAEAATRAMLETNLFGTLAMSRAFAPVLQANGGGALVNMLSVLTWFNLPGTAAYGISKAAAWAMTNSLRNELRPNGTLVVGAHAAFIDTDMAKNIRAPKSSPADVAAQVLDAVEAGRWEVLPDDTTRGVKRDLVAEPPAYARA